MFLGSLFENKIQRPVKVIYPGRFEPWHSGHAAVYQHLVKNYGSDNVFIVTSNKTDSDRSPFSFDEKRQMMVLTGISASKVVQSTQPYRAMEIVSTLSPNTVLLFAVSAKDMAEDPRFSFAPKKDGSPSYFQPFKDLASCQGLDKAAYMITVPTFEFTVLGKPATSASQIRAQFAAADENTQKKIVADLFGKFDNNVYSIMRSKLGQKTVSESKLIKDEFTVTDFKIARFESWADYTRFLSSPKSSKRDTVWSWPSGVAKLLSPSKSGLLSESKRTKDDRAIAQQFSTRFKQLDHRDAIVIKKGNSISVLSSILDLDKKSVEIRGFVTPKKIAAINTNNDGSIDVIEFDDGSQFPERNELTNVLGKDITNTIFFANEGESTRAYTEIWMMMTRIEGNGWEINNQLSESEITDTTQGKNMTNLKEYANDAEYYESFEQWQKDVRRFGGDYEHGGDGCYYAHGIDGESIGRWDERTGEGWIDPSGDHEYMGSNDSLGEESVDEGRFVKGPGGVPLDRRGNAIPPKVDAPKAPRAPAGPRRDSNGLTKDDYSKVWRKIEDVVGNIFPDGDPIDWLAPWLKKSGIQDYHVGEVLDKACRMNGYKDMYEYYNSFKTADYGYNESVGESLGGVPWGTPQKPTSAHQKELARKRMEYEKSLNQQQAKRGETYHSGNAVVTKPRVGEEQVNELSVDSLKNYASAANRNRTKVTQQQQGKYDPRVVNKMDRRAEFAMRAYNKAGLDKLLAKTESLVANLKQHTANGDRVAVAECLTQLKPLFNKLNESQKKIVSESLKKI